VSCDGHEDDLLFVVDLVEEAPISNTVAPRFWSVSLQLADVISEVGMADELGVNHIPEPAHNVGSDRAGKLSKISLELFGLEDPVLTQ
jgi:hypothetical protein